MTLEPLSPFIITHILDPTHLSISSAKGQQTESNNMHRGSSGGVLTEGQQLGRHGEGPGLCLDGS